MWHLHIGRSSRPDDVDIYEFDEEPQRNQRGEEVEWFGISSGEEILIEYNTDDVLFSFILPSVTDEEKKAGGLIIRQTPFYDNGSPG